MLEMTPKNLRELLDSELSKYDHGAVQYKEKYYQALMAYCNRFKPKSIMDLGHNYGDSAWAMAKYSKEVFSFDISDVGRKRNRVPLLKNCHFVLLPEPLDCLSLPFEQFDFIFVDIDHRGDKEAIIHENIAKSGYKGFVFWDDVNINDGMREFWRNIESKYAPTETGWHDPTGFGITIYY